MPRYLNRCLVAAATALTAALAAGGAAVLAAPPGGVAPAPSAPASTARHAASVPALSLPTPPLPTPTLPGLLPNVTPTQSIAGTPGGPKGVATLPPTPAPSLPPAPAPTAASPAPTTSTAAGAPTGQASAAPAPLKVGPTSSPPAAGGGAGRQESPTGAEGPPALTSAIALAFDTPLGPAPPLAGFLLLILSAALAIRRHTRQADRDRRLEAAKVQFLKVASHELRTPLTVIRGYVSMAADGTLGALPEGMRRALPSIESEVDQLERLVEQMLLAARLDEQVLFLERRRVDLREVVRACLSGIPDADPARPRHRLVVETGTDAVPVLADPARIGNVLGNLVDNAIKYSPTGGQVTVRVDQAGGRARLVVADHGLGIEAGDMDKLFTRFGRIVTTENSHIFGSGLGLYLARELTRLHGGDVKVASEPGRGSTFTVTLPLAVSPLARVRRYVTGRRRGGRLSFRGSPDLQ